MAAKKKSNLKKLMKDWHYRIGLIAAIFVAHLAVTGILMNHSRTLRLHEVDMSFGWLLKWYGIPADIDQPVLTLERIIIDSHSGQLFGITGPWMMDIAGLALLFLMGSGIYTYLKKNENKKKNKKK